MDDILLIVIIGVVLLFIVLFLYIVTYLNKNDTSEKGKFVERNCFVSC